MIRLSTSSSILRSALAILVVGSALAMAHADAATQRDHFVTATADCSGPIPSSDGALRRSPLGIRNNGSSNVFISCSLPADSAGDEATASVMPYFHNFGAADVIVNCTLTAGSRWNGDFGSVSGWAVVAPDDSTVLYWDNVDKHDYRGSYNFSCILPPDVELGTIQIEETDVSDGL